MFRVRHPLSRKCSSQFSLDIPFKIARASAISLSNATSRRRRGHAPLRSPMRERSECPSDSFVVGASLESLNISVNQVAEFP